MHRVIAAVVLGASIVVGAPLGADERRPLPPFDLISPSGAVVTGTRFAAGARGVVVYVAPSCGSCDRLLGALVQWRSTLPVDRIAVIVQGDVEAARRYVQEQGIDAAGFAWYVDAAGAASRALEVAHLPAFAGVEGSELSWSIDGVLNQPDVVEPVIREWLTR